MGRCLAGSADNSKLSKPSISTESGPLFWQEPPAIFEATKSNLAKLVRDVIASDSVLSVTDPGLPAANLSLQVTIA